MLMAHSVEGRFPFLDRNVAALAESLPSAYKLRVLDEKHVLKRAALGVIPEAIVRRSKQPYRAPDALSFASPRAADWIEAVADTPSLKDAGVYDPAASRLLIEKCRQRATEGQFSNTDNMAVVGLLSTQLVFDQFIRRRPTGDSDNPADDSGRSGTRRFGRAATESRVSARILNRLPPPWSSTPFIQASPPHRIWRPPRESASSAAAR